jgi:hypothetical protein
MSAALVRSDFNRWECTIVERTISSFFIFSPGHACVDPSLHRGLADRAIKNYRPRAVLLGMGWVDYIFTTANSWKTPIKDFTLVIDRRRSSDVAGVGTQYVSLCWDGPINKLDADHVVARKTNFVPQKELNVAFISFLGPPG